MTKDVAVGGCMGITINKWDVNSARHALDDATKEMTKSKLGLQENFSLIDSRLVLCTVSVLFTIVALIYDYVCPYPDSRSVLIVCILGYFITTTILTWHAYFVEGSTFFVGIQKDKAGLDPPNKWTFASKVKKYCPDYNLAVTFVDGVTKSISKVEVTKTIDCFFDKKGTLCADKLEAFVMNACNDIASKKKN